VIVYHVRRSEAMISAKQSVNGRVFFRGRHTEIVKAKSAEVNSVMLESTKTENKLVR